VKIEDLSIAGFAAPLMRRCAGKNLLRRVAMISADGEVVGYTTLLDLQKSLLIKRQIEFDVIPDAKPTLLVCRECGRDVVQKRSLNNLCRAGFGCRAIKCQDCGKNLSSNACFLGSTRCQSCQGIANRKHDRAPRHCLDCSKVLSTDASRKNSKRCGPCSNLARRTLKPAYCKDCTKALESRCAKRCNPCAAAERNRAKREAKNQNSNEQENT
jgi:hypothetical protein